MKIYNLKSNAKVNVGLNILEKLENGYHLLDMIMLPISLSDNLLVKIDEEKTGDLKITTNDSAVPVDKRNIINKARNLFYENVNLSPLKMEIYLEKNIPAQAGLGGGSSNAAAVLIFLNEYHGKLLSDEELIKLGKKVGADVPFFILNKPARVQGIGEKIEEIENNLKTGILLIKPSFGISTESAYNLVDKLNDKKMADIDAIKKGVESSQLKLVEDSIENVLEQALLLESSELKKFKDKLQNIDKMKFFMSGSGSTYFSFMNEMDFLKYKEELDKLFNDCEVYFCNFK